MNNENVFHKIWHWFFPTRAEPQASVKDEETQAHLNSLIQMVIHTEDEELSCDEVFELLDQYAELNIEGQEAAGLLPLVKEHLERCKDCREEYEALLRVIAGMQGTES